MKNIIATVAVIALTATGAQARSSAEVAMDRIIGAIDEVKSSITGELALVYETLDTKIENETLERQMADELFANSLEEEKGFVRNTFDSITSLITTETEERIREDLALQARVTRLEQQVALLLGDKDVVISVPEQVEAPAVVVEPIKLIYTVNVRALNFRTKGHKDSMRIGILTEGQEVEVVGINQYGWAEVIVEGKTGFVAARYLTKVE